MSKPRDPQAGGAEPERARRRWVHAPTVALPAAALLATAAAALVLREDAEPPRRARTSTRAVPPPAQADQAEPAPAVALEPPSAVPVPREARPRDLLPPRTPPPPPRVPADVARADALPAELAAWAQDAALAPEVRYTSLRRLERDAPAEAVTLATALLGDPVPFLRTNALAVLARSTDPRGREALATLDPQQQRLALALARRPQ